jgi:hypothetical protein
MAQILEFGACQQKRDEIADAAHVTREASNSERVKAEFDAMWKRAGAVRFDEIFADHAERTATMENV